MRYFIFIILFMASSCADFAEVFQGGPKSSKPAIMHVDGTYYIVQEGDTLESVSLKYSLTIHELANANALEDTSSLTAEQKLLIPRIVQKAEETTKTKKEKSNKPEKKISEQSIEPENSAYTKKEETPVKDDDKDTKDSKFIWPVDGIVTSLMGPRRGRSHDGIDIAAPFKTPIHAIKNGTVIFSGTMSGYGNLVIVKHTGNYFSAYAHMSEIKSEKGQKVKQGDLLGLVGRTGRASATHLHFEIRYKTKPVDPLPLLPKRDPSTIRKTNDDLIEE